MAAIALLVKIMEENQQKLMEKLEDQESFWEEKTVTQRDDLVEVFEQKELALGIRIKRQENMLKELRREMVLHHKWEKQKDEVMLDVWAEHNEEAAPHLPVYPNELIRRHDAVLRGTAAAPTPPE